MEGEEPVLQERRREIAQGLVNWKAEAERRMSFSPFGLCVS